MAPTDVLYERPGVTGLLLGVALWVARLVVDTDIALVAFLMFAFGVVVAIWSEDWWSPAGQALSVAGAFIILVRAVGELLEALPL